MKKRQKLYIIHALWRAKQDQLLHNLHLIVLGTAGWLIAPASTHRKQPQRELQQPCNSLSTLTSNNSLTNFLSLIFPSPATTSGESLELHGGKGRDWLSRCQGPARRMREDRCVSRWPPGLLINAVHAVDLYHSATERLENTRGLSAVIKPERERHTHPSSACKQPKSDLKGRNTARNRYLARMLAAAAGGALRRSWSVNWGKAERKLCVTNMFFSGASRDL